MRASFRSGGVIAACALALAAPLVAAGCGDDEDPAEPPTAPAPAAEPPVPTGEPEPPAAASDPEPGRGDEGPPPDKDRGPVESGEGDPRLTGLERAAMRTVEEFVAALDARDGDRACALLAPGAIDELELPRRRGGCAASLEASIGYRDPRGLPVWRGAELSRVGLPELDGETAKVVATVVTRFADRDEVSIEDDVVYLVRAGAGWAIAKPSSTLYRAVGIADVPPSVLSPP